jgi:hypothetical protein
VNLRRLNDPQQKEVHCARDWKIAYRMWEAAAATGFGESTLWKKVAEGKLEARRDGKATVVERDELVRYIRSLPKVRPSKGRSQTLR